MSPDAQARTARLSFYIGIGLMVVGAFSFALSNNLIKASYDTGVTVLTALTARAWLGTLALLALSIARGHRLTVPRAALWLLVLTTAANGIQNPAMLFAFKFIPISLSVLIVYLFPIIVAVATAVLGHDRITRPVAIAALIGFAGVALILELGTIVLDWRGMALAFLAACALSTNVMGAARLNRHLPALVVPLWLYAASAPFYTAALFAQSGPHFPAESAGWAVFLGGVMTLPVALAAFYSALPRAGAARAALVMNFEPLFTVLLAVILLGETLGPMQIAGGILIIGSIFYVSIYGRR